VVCWRHTLTPCGSLGGATVADNAGLPYPEHVSRSAFRLIREGVVATAAGELVDSGPRRALMRCKRVAEQVPAE